MSVLGSAERVKSDIMAAVSFGCSLDYAESFVNRDCAMCVCRVTVLMMCFPGFRLWAEHPDAKESEQIRKAIQVSLEKAAVVL